MKTKVKFRMFVVLVVVGFLAWDIFPLGEKDFYEVIRANAVFAGEGEARVESEKKFDELIKKSKELQAQEGNQDLYAAKALEAVAEEMAIDLKPYSKRKKDVNYNHDVVSGWKELSKSNIRYGIDLAGGVEFLLFLSEDTEVTSKKVEKINVEDDFQHYRDTAIEILRSRLEEKGISETEISPSGERYISLKAPIVSKDEKDELQRLIQMSAKLNFRLIHENNSSELAQRSANSKYSPVGYEYMTYLDQTKGKEPQVREFFVKRKPEMDGKNIDRAGISRDQVGNLQISLTFNSAGAKRFGDVTEANINRQLGIVLDGRLYSAPNIQGAIRGGNAVITGSFAFDEAKNISRALESGSLPVKMDIAAKFDIDPTLGRETGQSGIKAAMVALALVMVFMLFYYKKAGAVACLALGVNVLLVLGMLSAFGATLTLPGIAGIILTIGMAVDANVLIFERIREEISLGKGLDTAIRNGYDRAFTTIFDANLTTLFTAIILMNVGSGPIKGFAVTLSIGIITSMFTALYMTRLLFDLWLKSKSFNKMGMLSLVKNSDIDFLSFRKVTAGISGVLIVMTLGVLVIRGVDNFGIDFTGGTQMTFNYDQEVKNTEIEKTLKTANYAAKVSYKTSLIATESGDNNKLEIIIRDKSIEDTSTKNKVQSPRDVVEKLLNETYPEGNFAGGQEMTMGGLVGWEFSKSAMMAMFLAVLGIIAYISVRFEFAFAVASIVAVIHDVVIATGIFLICGGELTLPVVAALLTITGYSLNDTIVVFDRIREDLELNPDKGYKQIINLSINQTLSRTLITSVTTLLVLVVLVAIGGIAVRDFVLVMLLGVCIGTYSSIFVASPIVAIWHKRIGAKREKKVEEPAI